MAGLAPTPIGTWDEDASFRVLVEGAQLAVTVLDRGRIAYANAAFERLLGLSPGAASGRRPEDFVHPDSLEACRRRVEQVLDGDAQDGSFETTMVRPDGAHVDIETVADLVRVAGRRAVSLISCDVTERKRREAHLAHLATHDPLTGLPNRVLLLDRLEQALARAGRSCAGVLVLYLDLDGFKAVNDTYGHPAGDEVLRQVGVRLRAALRAGDTVSRLSGDEFVVCAEMEDLALGAALQDRVAAALAEPVHVGPVVLPIRASTGALVLEHGADPLRVLGEADRRMYADKLARAASPRPPAL